MTLVPVAIESFGGLDLRRDPAEVGLSGAIDMENCELDTLGRVRSRSGTSVFNSGNNGDGIIAPFRTSGGTTQLILLDPGSNFRALANDGSVVASSASVTGSYSGSIVRFAAPGSTYAYCTTKANAANVRRWDGSSWTSPAGMPNSNCLAVTPWDNRLVAADAGSTSRVKFSDPGAPETFGSNNYIDLRPGDGEPITAMAAWNGALYVFKRTIFFRFYGTSTDSTGNPIFNYTAIDVGVGHWPTESTVATHPTGVFFIAEDGVYVTTGGTPQKISGPLDPLFTSTGYAAETFFGAAGHVYSTVSITIALSCVGDRLLFTMGSTGLFVFHIPTGTWWFWSMAFQGRFFCEMQPSSGSLQDQRVTFISGGDDRVLYLDRSVATDYRVGVSPAAFTSYYRSGFGDFGYPGQEKVVRETELAGCGTVTFSWSRDYGAPTSTSSGSVTLGTSPTVLRKLHRKSQDGELFSWKATSTTAWTLGRVTPYIRDVRGPAELTA